MRFDRFSLFPSRLHSFSLSLIVLGIHINPLLGGILTAFPLSYHSLFAFNDPAVHRVSHDR